ncbi:RraA family protein [Amorphus sp. 3PC139-8]|uniref:RraA family protein n=1 Tax=Amorphus sp. 3PC139-8 TaxID=2735676 RepID=UPI00345D86E1
MSKEAFAAEFRQFPTSCLSDAMDELGLYGVLSGIQPLRHEQPRISGKALPVRFQRKSGDPDAWRFGGGVGKPLEQVLKTMANGHVVVMDLDGASDASAWGGLAAQLAQRKGVRGTVLWGTCRDAEEIRGCGYPVWSTGVCPRRSRNEFTFGSINEPITIGRCTIGPGDLIVADGSGVVCIPKDRAAEILKLAQKISHQEAVLEAQVLDDRVSSWDEL